MPQMRVKETDGQTDLDGVFIAKVKGTTILIRGHGKRFEEYAEKFRDLEKQGIVVIQDSSDCMR